MSVNCVVAVLLAVLKVHGRNNNRAAETSCGAVGDMMFYEPEMRPWFMQSEAEIGAQPQWLRVE